MKKTKFKSNLEIAEEWNEIAYIRHQQIKQKRDISFHKVLLPTIFEVIEDMEMHFNKIIDIGCGTGYLTNELTRYATKVLGIDISEKSIEIAIQEYSPTENLLFKNTSIEKIRKDKIRKFDLAIANMVLMDVSNLEETLSAIYDSLNNEAEFVFTITHPFFWPKYWGYDNEDWFDYKKEIFIETDFKISNERTQKKTSHIHRPLERYFLSLRLNGFKIVNVIEPMPNEETMRLYSKKWKYPRFLLIHCKKRKNYEHIE